ncbi:MAG: BamA/TamA family outer membrane protein [Bryobacteraceae bacterium]
MRRASLAFLYCLACTSTLNAQSDAQTRKQELEERRNQEGGVYGEDELTKVEQGLIWADEHKVLERLTRGFAGVRVVFGNLMPSSGFGLGPEYYRNELKDGAIQFRTSVRASTGKSMFADAELSFPKLLNRNAYVDLYTRWRNNPRVSYYGPGPDSKKSGRTAFRLEDAAYDVNAGLTPVPRVRLGVAAGYLQTNVGPSDDPRYASAETVYSPANVPGLDRQSSFLRGGVVASYDWRDHPGGARYGGFYEARFDYYKDQDAELFSHRRLTLEAQQYIPFANRRRVIALRAKTLLTYANPGQVVPFYMQPLLGGQNDLRGFRFGRFYDNNVLVLNGEYRWEIFTGLDGALFYDAGKVFSRRSQLNFHDLEGAAGFGFRVNARNSVFLRLDVGFSHEGFQLWFSFNDVFGNSGGVTQSLYGSRYLPQ